MFSLTLLILPNPRTSPTTISTTLREKILLPLYTSQLLQMSVQNGDEWAPRKNIIIIGSGWAGSTLETSLDETKYSLTVISPETTTPCTPLLASAACGLYDFNIVETPIRHTIKKIKFVKARVESIDFKAKSVKCIPCFDDLSVKDFTLDYDIVVIAPGVSFLSVVKEPR
jgi:NADH:ubiquinone reductase (non-electrogenic)